jgi:hypothetical protein
MMGARTSPSCKQTSAVEFNRVSPPSVSFIETPGAWWDGMRRELRRNKVLLARCVPSARVLMKTMSQTAARQYRGCPPP